MGNIPKKRFDKFFVLFWQENVFMLKFGKFSAKHVSLKSALTAVFRLTKKIPPERGSKNSLPNPAYTVDDGVI